MSTDVRDPSGGTWDGAELGDRLRRGSRSVRRQLLKDVRAVGNTWARATARHPLPTVGGEIRPPDGQRTPWPAYPPKGYLGQLEPAFQRKLSAERSSVTLDDCDFYHTSDLSDGTTIPGYWDLRGVESSYIGDINVAGDRVLELGPATGALTWFMEKEGADLVTFDIGYDVCGDILPTPEIDVQEQQRNYLTSTVIPTQNSWWYLHRDHGSNAKAVYGNIYALPGDLGEFDTAIFAAILLHLRDPFLALQQAASRAKRRLVVTDVLQDPSLDPDQNVSRFGSAGFANLSIWWTLTPEGIRHMLRFLGFDRQTTTFTTQTHHVRHDLSAPPVHMDMFTVVAERSE